MMERALLYNATNKLSSYDKLFPWDYYLIAREFIKEKIVFLNLSGNFTEKLLENKYAPCVIGEISGTDPCLTEALKNAGAKFYCSLNEAEDDSFNLITSRFKKIDLTQIKAKLKKGGYLIAEEIGFATFESIAYALNMADLLSCFDYQNNLENRRQQLINEGFRVVTRNQEYKEITLSKAELNEFISALSVFIPEAKFFKAKLENFGKENFGIVYHRFIYTAKKIK